MPTTFSTGLAHKFCRMFKSAGGTPHDMNRLAQEESLMRELVRGSRPNPRWHGNPCDLELHFTQSQLDPQAPLDRLILFGEITTELHGRDLADREVLRALSRMQTPAEWLAQLHQALPQIAAWGQLHQDESGKFIPYSTYSEQKWSSSLLQLIYPGKDPDVDNRERQILKKMGALVFKKR